jgi:hypothetical protein
MVPKVLLIRYRDYLHAFLQEAFCERYNLALSISASAFSRKTLRMTVFMAIWTGAREMHHQFQKGQANEFHRF